MPLGIVSSDDFNKALIDSSMSNDEVNETKIGQVIDIKHPGRSVGDVNVPATLRNIIGEEAHINGRASAISIAKSFDISHQQVAAYTNGATSEATYHDKDKSLDSHITNAKMKVTKRAMSKLLKSMHHITDDKLLEASVTELSSVAKNMSSIVKDMSPEDNSNDRRNPVQFIVMAPQIVNENRFETVYAKD